MNSTKYIGVDVHKEATTIAVMNPAGKLVMESIVETKAATIVQFLEGLRGELYVTFEEGTWAAWLYDLLKPHVTKVVVCNPRKNASGFPTTCPHSLAETAARTLRAVPLDSVELRSSYFRPRKPYGLLRKLPTHASQGSCRPGRS